MSERTDTTRPASTGSTGREGPARSVWLGTATTCSLCWLVAFAFPSWANEDLEPVAAEEEYLEMPVAEDVEPPVAEDVEPPAAEAVESAASGDEDVEPASAEEPDPELELAEELDLDLEIDEHSGEAIVFQEIPSVYGVSRFEQKITEAPSFVTLITSKEIEKYGYRTLAEALQSVTGFFTTYDRNYNRLGVRGFNRQGDFNSRVLVLVDGHRLNDNLYDQGSLGTEAVIDVDLIDRIEVIRGPSSSLYGTNAFLGVINVITKRGRDVRGGELSTEIGSYDTYRVRGTYGDRFSNGVEMLLSGSFYDSEGHEFLYYNEFDDPASNNGITQNADKDSFPSFFGKLSFRDFTLQGGLVSREKGIPTAAYGTFFPTDQTRSLDEHSYIFLKYDRQFDSKFHVSGRAYYDRFYYRGDYLYDIAGPPTPDLVLNQDRSEGEWWGVESKVDTRLFDSHNVTAGFEFRQDVRQDLWNADLDPTIVYLDDERDSWNVAAFLQDEFSILDNLILNVGVRYDHYDTFGSTVNPRIALIYNLNKTTFKVLYGTAFRGPNPYERYYVGTGFKANPDLDPEEITTYEIVVEHALTPYIRATVAGYLYQIDQLVSQELDGGELQFQNRGEIEAKGLEFQLELDDTGPLGLAGRFGYALQEAVDRRSGNRLTNSPTHLVNMNVIAPLLRDKLFGGFELIYTSDRKTLAGDIADDYVVSNFTLTLKNLFRGMEVEHLFRGLDLSASIRNLFNEKYSDPGSGENVQDLIAQDGRNFWLKVKYGF